MAYSAQDFHDAFARAPASPVVGMARDLLVMADAARNDPRYAAFERRVGPDAARRHVLDSGLAALADNQIGGGASYTASEPTQAEAERKTANALQALFPHASAERVGTRAPEVLARLGRGQQLRLATSDAGTAAAIVQSVLHVDPNAAHLRAAKKASGGETPGRGDSEHFGHAGRRERGAFARDRFGHIQHGGGGGEQRSASGGGSERYGALPGNNGITYGAERYSFAQMAQYASAQGVPWAVHTPELMRLGPSAIKTIADAGIKQPTYKALTNEAKFKAKDVVNLAHLAKDTGQNATDLSNDTVKTFKKYEPSEHGRQQLGRIFGDYLDQRRSDPKGAGTKLKARVHEHFKTRPASERGFQPLMRRYGVVAAADAKATKQAGANVVQAKTDTAQARNDQAKAKADTSKMTANLDRLNALGGGAAPPKAPAAPKPS